MDTKVLLTGIISFIAGALLVSTVAVAVEGCSSDGGHARVTATRS